MLKWLFYSLLLLSPALQLKGQSVENMDKAIEMLDKVSKVGDSGQVSFDIRYTYANEHQPGILLDSLEGNIRMSAGSFYSRMRNTVLLVNKHYNVAVFDEDKLIHVSRPVNRDSIGVTPMQMINASIRQAGIQRCLITTRKDTTVIRFVFSPSANYKYMELKLDTRNWCIHQLQFVIKSEMIPDTDTAQRGSFEAYALVKAAFIHYSKAAIDPVVFDEGQFFTRTATALIPAEAYHDYEVFIGSPNL